MHIRSLIRFILCLSVLLSLFTSTSTAGEYGIVITKTGVKYENVSITVDHNLQIVILVRGTEEIKIGFGAIESIINGDGKNVTVEMLTEKPTEKADSSGAGLYATVETKSGTVFENAYIVVDYSLQVITVAKGTEQSKMGFGAIESITNSAGKDITSEILGEAYGKKEKPTASGVYGTVVTKSGDKYRDVHISVDQKLGIVRLVKGTEETKLGFSAIESITNSAGRDITSEILGESYGEEERTLGPSTYGVLITKSGYAYQIASLIVDHNKQVVRIIKGNDETRIAFNDVESITDLSGKDITEQFLGGNYGQKTDYRYTALGPGLRRYKVRPWHLGFSLVAVYSKPFGEYYKGIDGQGGPEGSIFLTTRGMMSLRLIVAKVGMSLKDVQDLPPGTRAEISAMKFIFGSQYTYPYPSERKAWTFLIHGMFGGGIISHELSVKGHYYEYNPDTGFDEDRWIDESETKANFVLHWDFGTTMLVSKNVGVDFSLAYGLVFGSSTSYYGVAMLSQGYLFDIKGGLVFMF